MVRDLEAVVEIKQAIFGDTGETDVFHTKQENSLWESHFFHNSQRMRKFFWHDIFTCGVQEFYLRVFPCLN